MTAKAEELLKSVGEKLKQVVGFGKVLVAVVKEMITEDSTKVDSLKNAGQQLQMNGQQISQRINTTIEPNPTVDSSLVDTTDLYTEVFEEELPTSLAQELQNDPLYESLFSTSQKVKNLLDQMKPIGLGIAVLLYYQQPNQLDELIELLRTNSEALFKKYEKLEEKYADTEDEATKIRQIKEEIRAEIKQKIRAIQTTILQNIQKRD